MHIVGTWGCAMYHGDDSGDEGKASVLRVSKTLAGSTLRQIIRTTIGGSRLNLVFSNEYGETEMVLQSVHIAKAAVPACSDIDTSTGTAVTFGGKPGAVILPGEKLTSDIIDFEAGPLERLAVSIFFGDVPGCVACHVGARANSFIKPGSAVSDETLQGSDVSVNTHWFALSNVNIAEDSSAAASIVVLGDSITDGFGVTDEQYTRWTDVLAAGLQANPNTQNLSLINMGIGTNMLLGQENPPAGMQRFERDVLSQPGIGYFVFFIGVNDLAFSPATSAQLISGYEEMVDAAKARAIKTIACTVLPYSKPDPRRHEINGKMREWHRTGCIDGLIDFDALVKDPQNLDRMRAEFNNDGIHPTALAYKAMGEYALEVLRL